MNYITRENLKLGFIFFGLLAMIFTLGICIYDKKEKKEPFHNNQKDEIGCEKKVCPYHKTAPTRFDSYKKYSKRGGCLWCESYQNASKHEYLHDSRKVCSSDYPSVARNRKNYFQPDMGKLGDDVSSGYVYYKAY